MTTRALLAVAAASIILSEFAGQYWRIANGIWDIKTDLPLHLCDIAGVAVIWFALARAWQPVHKLNHLTVRVGELAYFWTLAGSTQALLTPDLALEFPHVAFWDFFVSHGTAWAAIVGLAAGGGLHIRPGAYLPSWLITLTVGAIVGAMNVPLGSNYMYTCGPPGQASVYDYFGPWPFSLLSLAIAGLLLFGLCERLYLAYWVWNGRIRAGRSEQLE